MCDFPNNVFPEEPAEDFSVGVLLDTDDGAVENVYKARCFRTASSGADVLRLHRPTSSTSAKTGADVLSNFSPRSSKINSADSINDASVDKETFVFSMDKASKAVKHFVGEEIKKKKRRGADVVDAFGDQEPAPSSPSLPSAFPLVPELKRQDTTIEEEFSYDMDHKERGCFIIFNQKNFDQYNKKNPKSPLKIRYGTDKDASNLKNAAHRLGFEHVRVIHDATRDEIVSWVETMAGADHSNYDCFACGILTHGGDGDVLYAADERMKLTDFTRPFGADKCESLAGKPKLFFIQACRGFKLDHGKKMTSKVQDDFVDGVSPIPPFPTQSDDRNLKEISIPAEADFLIANSTVSDYYAWRSESNGSWFIQSLCAIFAAFGHKWELMRMMTRINRMVAYDYASASTTLEMNEKKQIPSIATRLTAEVFFKPKRKDEISLRASVSPPSASVSCTSRMESQVRIGSFVGGEFITGSSSAYYERVLFPSGDFQISPYNPNAETFLYPSPQNVTRPHLSSSTSPSMTPNPSSSSLRSLAVPFSNTPPSGSVPTSPGLQINPHSSLSPSASTPKFINPRTSDLQCSEDVSRSWDAGRGSFTPVVLRRSSLSNPHLQEHRCSLPENQLTSMNIRRGSIRKDFKQTHL